MTDNEFLLFDRIEVIKQTIDKYGEDTFSLSYSGGKDSTVLHYLLDLTLPNNRIPRVFSNTGIEYLLIVKYVKEMAERDDRFVIIQPSHNIKETLERVGYPFKSKNHARTLATYQHVGEGSITAQRYLNGEKSWKYTCPDNLRYQFTPEFKIKISDGCCTEMKEKPLWKFQHEAKRNNVILGLMTEEGGRRENAKCIAYKTKGGKGISFSPLVKVTKDWEDWFIQKYNIKLCDLYYEPYNFVRTGCKGCPFAPNLKENLEVMERYFPNERKQCEYIWKPIYEEYRRIGYRLKKDEQVRLL